VKAPLISAENLTKTFHGSGGHVRALDGITFSVEQGSTLALVGESGSGKTTAARMVLGLDTPDTGSVAILGEKLETLKSEELRVLRRSIQVVQQDPYSQLNRRHSVQRIIEGPLIAFGETNASIRKAKAIELLDAVGLERSYLNRRPHELSGGQCQRVAIARALIIEPKILVLDEAVSALDVSIRAQVLNLLRLLQRERSLTYLFITHDLGVAKYMADNVAVMFRGKIMEKGNRNDIFKNSSHHYTRNLISSVPRAEPPIQRKQIYDIQALPGVDEKDACSYRSRCSVGLQEVKCQTEPVPVTSGSTSHDWLCHFPLKNEGL
jgi:oligopeptide/dipeptide ABC transporter ATP-binding protein